MDYAENPYFVTKMRHFSCICAEFCCGKVSVPVWGISFLTETFHNFYKTIDFCKKIRYNGVIKRVKQIFKPPQEEFAVDKNELKDLLIDAVDDADLHPEEIPSIDLYLDQITSLVDEKRKEGSPRFADRALTKTMINNYSKDGLLSPIKGKKYTKEQILQMLLVYEMKNTLSIGEIKRVLQNVYSLPEYDSTTIERVYNRYLNLKRYIRNETIVGVEALVESSLFDLENEEHFLDLVLSLSAMSSYYKNVVQALLEAHYPDLNAEKTREEQEKKEAAKRQKAEQKAEKKASKTKKESTDETNAEEGK